jgi:transcriptional regulator GlxA family with amidase domain
LSYSRLSRLFKQQTGVTIIEFCHRQKVDRFRELYGAGQRFTILQAALEAGFGSYPTFHRVFHRLTGLSPAAYRRQVRAGADARPSSSQAWKQ